MSLIYPTNPQFCFQRYSLWKCSRKKIKRFVKLLRNPHISIPFTKAISQIPSQAKFVKEIMFNKCKLEDNENNVLIEDGIIVIQNQLDPMLKDPGYFLISCVIGTIIFNRVLCDLGASVNSVPLSICKRLDLNEIQVTKISLQLVDISVIYLVGILEGIPIRIGQLYITTNIVIREIEEDTHILILLGRSLSVTIGAIIYVKKGKFTFEI